MLLLVLSLVAQVDTSTLNANIGGLARLSLSSTTLTFPDADPDTVPIISGVPSPLTITAKARAGQGMTVTLTVRANNDLRSGVNTIPAGMISWTASGAGFVGGTLSSTAARTVASWAGSGVRTGTQTYAFQNRWTYPTGTYTLTMTYTLSAP
jgi:hypothetical protein